MTTKFVNTLRSAWHRTKDGFRSFLGIYSYVVTWRCLFARLWFPVSRIQTGTPTDRYLVALPTFVSEGIGGQFVKWNTARILAKQHGLTFVHHPFTSSSHSPDIDWERFLGFGAGEVAYGSLANSVNLRLVDVPPLHIRATHALCHGRSIAPDFVQLTFDHLFPGKSVCFRLGPSTYMDDQARDVAELKRKYRAARTANPVECVPKSAELTVALHVRRGDVRTMKESGQVEGNRRWLEESYYANICCSINELVGVDQVAFRVYSDDPASSFKLLGAVPNLEFRTCAGAPVGPTVAFHEMVTADVLAVGLSSFSYLAALLAEGVILIPAQYPHTALPEWLPCDQNGSFDERAFRFALRDTLTSNRFAPSHEVG